MGADRGHGGVSGPLSLEQPLRRRQGNTRSQGRSRGVLGFAWEVKPQADVSADSPARSQGCGAGTREVAPAVWEFSVIFVNGLWPQEGPAQASVRLGSAGLQRGGGRGGGGALERGQTGQRTGLRLTWSCRQAGSGSCPFGTLDSGFRGVGPHVPGWRPTHGGPGTALRPPCGPGPRPGSVRRLLLSSAAPRSVPPPLPPRGPFPDWSASRIPTDDPAAWSRPGLWPPAAPADAGSRWELGRETSGCTGGGDFRRLSGRAAAGPEPAPSDAASGPAQPRPPHPTGHPAPQAPPPPAHQKRKCPSAPAGLCADSPRHAGTRKHSPRPRPSRQ